MNETFIIKAIIEIKKSSDVLNSMVIAEIEVDEFPTDEQIEEVKQKFHADRCEVAKCYR